tara:strand:+ start:56 stop:1270 length:1215 start_codon:yes stop_codon:yes gene_type:complete
MKKGKLNLPEESLPYLKQLSEMPSEKALKILQDAVENPTIKTTENENGTSLTSLSPRVKTLEQLLEVAKVDKEKYAVKKFKVKKWEVGLNLDGVAAVEELYAVSADLAPNTEYAEFQRIQDDLLEDLRNHKPLKINKRSVNATKGSYMLEVNIFDLHFGKLCWNGETGEDYDTKIAAERFHNAIDDLVAKAQFHNVEKIVFPVGNDFFNSDSLNNTTTAGTPQDEDLRWQKTFTNGRRLIVDGIEKLLQVAPVDVVIVQGNHDFQRSFYLGDSLTAWFRNVPEVNIDNSASPRKYVRYGSNLIGLTHGNNEKVAELPILMASEQKGLWADTKFHEWHLGHFHHKKQMKWKTIDEQKGCVIRFMRSLSGTDAWHNLKGYVQNVQSAESFLWHKDNGLVAHNFYNL